MVNLELDSKIRKDSTYLSQSGETIIPKYLDYILTIFVHWKENYASFLEWSKKVVRA